MTEDSDQRQLVRRHLLYYLEVRELNSEHASWRLGDISREGVLLLTDRELQPGRVLDVVIPIPPRLELGRETLRLQVQVMWSRPERPKLFNAGCRLVSAESADLDFMDELVKRIGFSDDTKQIRLKNDRHVFIEREK